MGLYYHDISQFHIKDLLGAEEVSELKQQHQEGNMTEPWSTIYVVTYLGAFTAAGGILLYWAIRWRSLALVLLSAAMVLWPIAGDTLIFFARRYVREALRAGDGMGHFTPDASLGDFLSKVIVFVHLVQSALVLAASIVTVRLLKREKSNQAKAAED